MTHGIIPHITARTTVQAYISVLVTTHSIGIGIIPIIHGTTVLIIGIIADIATTHGITIITTHGILVQVTIQDLAQAITEVMAVEAALATMWLACTVLAVPLQVR